MVPVPLRIVGEEQNVILTTREAVKMTNEAILEQKYPYLAEIFTDIKESG